MARIRRKGPRRRETTITEGERRWATGEPFESLDQEAEVRYFTPPERLRYAYQEATGEPIEAALAADMDADRLPGPVYFRGAVVGHLFQEDLDALRAGVPVTWGDPDGPPTR